MQFSINIVGANNIGKYTTICPGDVLDLDHGEYLYLGSYADYQQLIREEEDLLIPLVCKEIITIKNFFSDITRKKNEKTICFEGVNMTSDELTQWLTYPIFIVNKDNTVIRQLFITRNNPVHVTYFNLSPDQKIITTSGKLLNINDFIVPMPFGSETLLTYLSWLVLSCIMLILLF